ncbi:putative Lipase 3 [Daphnia magna]|uniref:Putative Lipase 3 n=1 Tax=Daphnia magna TaxID=35525 RepID=A0A164ZQY9_9CRUS|nr:putative Lipase 3 [Daphnia magna]
MILRRRFPLLCLVVLTTFVFSECRASLFKRRVQSVSTRNSFNSWRKKDASTDRLSPGQLLKNWRRKSIGKGSVDKLSAGQLLNGWRRKASSGGDTISPGRLLQGWRRNVEVQEANRLPQNVETFFTTPEIIRNRGYPVEIHHVTSEDGYILELHRIPAILSNDGTHRKAVFLQHGALEASSTWFVNPSNRSLRNTNRTKPFSEKPLLLIMCTFVSFAALLLADKSYDVWLGNFRGNRYSRRHVKFDPKQTDFWRFSWDEIGTFDIPVVINYILSVTGLPTLSYIGHSLGCGVFFIAMAKHPELNAKIDTMVALAPLSSFAHFTTGIFRKLAPYGNAIETFLRTVGTWGWLDSEGVGDILLQRKCAQTYQQAKRCLKALNIIMGSNPENLQLELMPLVKANLLHGTSVPVIAQFAQNYLAGETFQAYDFGRKGNVIRYGSIKPLAYALKNITAPVYIYSGGADRLVTPQDVDWLLTQLGNIKRSVRIQTYNHGDFLWV